MSAKDFSLKVFPANERKKRSNSDFMEQVSFIFKKQSLRMEKMVHRDYQMMDSDQSRIEEDEFFQTS